MKRCTRCKQEFPLTEFFKARSGKDGLDQRCKKCHIIMNKEWRQNNRDQTRKIDRDYSRKHRIAHVGGTIYNPIGKRSYPLNECCELCGQKVRLYYHHWDDLDFSKGMWICNKCHTAAHWLEKFNPDFYFDLKKKLNKE